MIYIDATEGLSGDMLLSGLLALLGRDELGELKSLMVSAAEAEGVELILSEVEDAGERGLAISYVHPEPTHFGNSYDECFSRLARMEASLRSESSLGRAILERIFEAEGEAHGLAPREVHLHEIARPQAILNIAGTGKVASMLLGRGMGPFKCSTIVTGSGIVVVSHGAFRVPAPASKILLRGLRHETGTSPGERATPTGIAAVGALTEGQTDDRPEVYIRKGVGFGTKRFAGRLGRTTLYFS
jgi:uncharacterized protein (DUF111 family)